MTLTYNETQRRINIMTVAIIAIAFFLIVLIPSVRAEEKEKTVPWGMAQMILSGPTEPIHDAVSGSIYQDLVLSSSYGGTAHSVYGTGGVVYTGGYGFLRTIYNSLKVLGGLWVIAIAMARLITNIDKGIDPMECVFKCLIEIGITFIFLINLDLIISALAGMGQWFVTSAMDGANWTANDLTGQTSDFLKGVTGTGQDNGSFSWWISAVGVLLVPWAMSWVSKIVIKFLIYQIIIEIALRKAFAPWAVADIYQEGLRSPGARYLKRILAAFIKLAICILIARMIQYMESSLATSFSGGDNEFKSGMAYVAEILVLNFTAIGGMFKTGEIANDVVGA